MTDPAPDLLRDFEAGRDEAGADALWDRCFGKARGGQTLAWLFRNGPVGAPPRSVAESDGQLVAHAGVAAIRFQVEGEETIGGYSVGAMTDPGHQGRGLFVRTAEHLYARLERDGFGFVAGFSNANSHHLHTTRLGRSPIRPFPWCIHLLRPLGAAWAVARNQMGAADPVPREAGTSVAGAQAVESGLEVRSVGLAPPELDALWAAAGSEVRVGAIRDTAYARWRYGERPDAGYAAWMVFRGGAPLAWTVGRLLPLRGLLAGFLTELVVAPGEPAAGKAAVRAFEGWVRGQGGQVANAVMPSRGTARETLRGLRYLQVPEALHPQVIRLSVLGLGAFAGRDVLADPAGWTLSWGDTDVV